MIETLPYLLGPENAGDWLLRHGLVAADEDLVITELSGGISSNVIRVERRVDCIVLKQPQPRLKVKAEWRIPLARVFVECDFLRTMASIGLGDYVPELLFCDPEAHVLAMRGAPADRINWKQALMNSGGNKAKALRLTQMPRPRFILTRPPGTMHDAAAQAGRPVGQLLAQLQIRTRNCEEIRERFDQAWTREQGRIEPYLLATEACHPELADELTPILHMLREEGSVLVHGDFSPKNMLIGIDGGLTLLDHEVAHWGHPAFDPAFCLTHLSLKILCQPPDVLFRTLEAWMGFCNGYCEELASHATQANQAHIARLLGWLLLARIDGRSPVEYITEDGIRDHVRNLATRLIHGQAADFAQVLELIERQYHLMGWFDE